jgi:hypothetical protein
MNKFKHIMPIEIGLAIATDNVKSFFKALNENSFDLTKLVEPTSGDTLKVLLEKKAPEKIMQALNNNESFQNQNNESNCIK